MFSSRMVRCSSPRPETMKVSVSAGYSTRSATLLLVSRSRRSRSCRLVTKRPSRPASGEALTRNFLRSLQAAAPDAADADLADVARVVERADLQLQRLVGVLVAHRHVLEDRGKERREIGAALARFFTRPALQGRSIDHREIQLLF